MATEDTGGNKVLLLIVVVIGGVLMWAVMNNDKKLELCSVGPCPQPTVSTSAK